MKFFRNSEEDKPATEVILKSVPFFADLSEDQIERIIARAEQMTIASDETLIRKGAKADNLYISLRGKFYVRSKNSTIAEIGPGEPIGEIAFFAGGKRTADVVAARTSEVMVFSREVYETLSRDIPEIASGVIVSLAKRVAASNSHAPKVAKRMSRSVAMIATSDNAFHPDLVAKIRNEIDTTKDWKYMDEKDAEACPTGQSVDALTNWVLDQEQEHKNLLLVCTSPDSAPDWTEAIVDNCDAIYVVGAVLKANEGPVPLSNFERQLFHEKKRQDIQLVLWRDKKEYRSKFVKNWLKDRILKLHHQLALDSDDDLKRLSQLIQGRNVDLFD